MSRTARRVLAAIVIVLAGVGELVFAGGQVHMCLGPLGVTPIQCAKVTGIVPTTPIAVPLFALALAFAAVLLAPVRSGRRVQALIAGAAAAGVAAFAFAVLSPRIWTGVDSAGASVSIDLPFDGAALVTVLIAAATVGGLGWVHLVARRSG
jgi:hypothetical protein